MKLEKQGLKGETSFNKDSPEPNSSGIFKMTPYFVMENSNDEKYRQGFVQNNVTSDEINGIWGSKIIQSYSDSCTDPYNSNSYKYTQSCTPVPHSYKAVPSEGGQMNEIKLMCSESKLLSVMCRLPTKTNACNPSF